MQHVEEGKNKQKVFLLADTKIPKHTKIQKRKQHESIPKRAEEEEP